MKIKDIDAIIDSSSKKEFEWMISYGNIAIASDYSGNLLSDFLPYHIVSMVNRGLYLITDSKENPTVDDIMWSDEKYTIGFINDAGKIVISCCYNNYRILSESLIIVERSNKIGLYNVDGESILYPEYDCISIWIREKQISFSVDGNKLIEKETASDERKLNHLSKLIKISSVIKKDNNYYITAKDEIRQGVVNEKGHIVIPIQYTKVTNKSEELIEVQRGMSYGLYKKDGSVFLPSLFNNIEPISFDRFIVSVNDTSREIGGNDTKAQHGNRSSDEKYGMIDIDGKWIFPLEYSNIVCLKDSTFWMVVKNKKCGVLNNEGNIVIPIEYDAFSNVYNVFFKIFKINVEESSWVAQWKGLLNVSYSNSPNVVPGVKVGLATIYGNIIVPCKYDDIFTFKNGIAKIKENGRYGMINQSGQMVIQPLYDSIDDFEIKMDEHWNPQNTIARVVKDGKCGLIDSTGKVIVPLEYHEKLELSYDEKRSNENYTYKFRKFNFVYYLDANGKVIASKPYFSLRCYNLGYQYHKNIERDASNRNLNFTYVDSNFIMGNKHST